ncbi:MAG: TIGR03086 family metal-binding protein [Actinomycetota bacterium]
MSENLRNFTKAVYGMDAVVRRVPAERWDSPSPCDGWSARDVVAHQVGVFRGLAETVRTGEMTLPAEPEERDDPVGLWSAARDEVMASLDRRGVLQQAGRFWFGEMTVDELIAVVQWDPLTHAWDVATAAGIDAHLDPGLAQRSYETISSMRPNLVKRQLVSAEEVEVPADADPVSRYLGLVGRNPFG